MKVGVLAKDIAVVDEQLYWYTYREGSLGHQKGMEPIEKVKDRVRAWHQTQLFLNSQGIQTKVYLPVMPCLRIFRRDKRMYFQLLSFMRKEGINYMRVLYETIRYSIDRVMIGKKDIRLRDVILI